MYSRVSLELLGTVHTQCRVLSTSDRLDVMNTGSVLHISVSSDRLSS